MPRQGLEVERVLDVVVDCVCHFFGGFGVYGFRDRDPVLGDLGTGVGFDCPADLDKPLSRIDG